jgi:hypothetical protein
MATVGVLLSLFNYAFSTARYIISYRKIILNNDLKDIKVVIKKLSQHLPARTEVNHETPHEGMLSSGLTIKSGVSYVRST